MRSKKSGALGDGPIASLLGFAIALLFLLGGLSVLAWQGVEWLRHGQWVSITLIDFLAWSGTQVDWVAAPTTWIGLWNLLDAIPLSLSGMILGGGIILGLVIEGQSRPPVRGESYEALFEYLRSGEEKSEE